MQRWIRLILRNRTLVIAILVAVTALAIWICSHAVIATSLARLFLGESPAYERYLELTGEFGSDEVVIVAFESSDLLASGEIERIRSAIERVEEIEEVGSVESIVSAQEVTAEDGALRVVAYIDDAEADQGKRGEVLDRLRNDENLQKLLVSADGRHTTVIVEFTPDPNRPAERGPVMLKGVIDAFVAAGYKRGQLHKVGMMPVVSDIIAVSQDNLMRLLPFVILVLIISVLVVFRAVLPMLVSGAVTLLATTWTMAVSVLIDPEISVLLSMVPVVVTIVGFSDVIHLYSAYLIELENGQSRHEAIVRSGSEVGRACLFTSLTTFVGFVSLSLIPTPAFRQMGIVLGFGVAIALVIAVTLMPVLLSVLPAPSTRQQASHRGATAWLDRLLLGVERLSVKRPWQVIAGFALLLAVAVFGLNQIHVETDMLARLSPESSARKDAEYFQRHFAGDSQLEVFIDSGRKDGALDPRLLADVLALQEDIAAVQGVDKVGSLVDLVEQIHAALGAKDGGRLPKSRKALAEYLVLFEMQGGKNLGRLVDFDRRMLRMGVRVAPTGVVAIYGLGEQVKALAAKRLGDRATVEASGMAYMLGEWIDDILNGQRKGLIVSILTIALMMIGVCRSIRVGLLSMLPNLLPLLVLGGYVGLFWDKVDTDTLTIAMLAIGIGVDDTIHFLSRYRIEANRYDDDEAITRTFNFAGRAILITTVILVLGFLPMAASNYFSTRIVGTLLPMTLIVALLADLLLVPALVKVRIMSLHRGS